MTKVSLVCYHYLARHDEFAKIRGHSKLQFQEHLDYYRKNFHFVSVSELLTGLTESQRTNLLITFDDGLKEHIQTFAPLLEQHGISGVFSVPSCILRGEPANPQITRFAESYYGEDEFYNLVSAEITSVFPDHSFLLEEKISNKTLFKWKLPIQMARQILLNHSNKYLLPKFPDFMQRIYLSENDIKQMRASGHVIAVHSDTHPVISRIKKEDQELLSQQIIFPKRELEKLLGEEVNIFTYPHGQKEEIFSDPAVLQDAGYKFVFTTFQDNTSFNPLSVGRYQSFVADTIQSLSDNIWTYTI